MTTVLLLLGLVAAFIALGKAADVVVVHIRHIGERLGLSLGVLGLVLGLFTSLPEFALGLNAYASQVYTLSFGNLIGGMVVLLGLVLGVSAVLNRRIKTSAQNGHTPFLLAYLFLPLLLGLDGQVGEVDAVVLALFFGLLAYTLFLGSHRTLGVRVSFRPHRFAGSDALLVLAGTVFVLLLSNGIVRITLELLRVFHVPAFLAGLFVFSLGTNLPEISVAIRSWRRHASELSLSHLFGSAMVNPLLIGLFSLIHPVTTEVQVGYISLMACMALLLIAVLVFCRSGNVLTRREGMVLIGLYLLIIISSSVLLPRQASAAMALPTKGEHARPATVSAWTGSFERQDLFTGFEKEFLNGGTLAVGDVNGDGSAEIVVGAGPGRTPEVRIFREDGTLLHSFRAYPEWFQGGVRVVVVDVDANGVGDIVTAPGPGIEPQVNLFRADGSQIVPGGVWAYAKGMLAGVHIAVGDTDGEGRPNIVTAPGAGAGPHVRVWTQHMQPMDEFFAYSADMTDGVSVAVARTSVGPRVVTAPASWSAPLVRQFTQSGELHKEFYAYDPASRSGASVAAWDMDADGFDEIVTAPNGEFAADLRVYDRYGTEYRRALVMDADYRGGVSMAPFGSRLFTMPVFPTVVTTPEDAKSVLVDLSQQRLYAFERGRLVRTFLVSTGTSRFPTPVMNVAVRQKVPVKTYRWSYGVNNPNNYNLPGVKWNLQINGPYYIHHAYWHNNFGNPMSHGCINVGGGDAEWIYNWVDVGTKVEVVS